MSESKRPKATRPRRKKTPEQIEPLMTKLSEATIGETMRICVQLQAELRFLNVRFLIEQRRRAHERRMVRIRQLSSAAVYLPVTFVKGVASVGRSITSGLKRRYEAKRSQEVAS